MKIDNAKIMGTRLGRQDHGILTFTIYVEAKMFSCGIGGYALDQSAENSDDYLHCDAIGKRKYSAKGMEAISKILDTVGVDKWEDLPGKYIRFEDNGWGSTITKIGNIIEDKWFDLEEFFSTSTGD